MYRVEVTADTLSELAGKLITLGSRLSLPAPQEVTTSTAPIAVLGLGSVSDPNDQVYVAETSAEPETADAKSVEPVEETSYDYVTQVAPRVLQMVAKRGRDAVKTLLSGFGVTKASELSADKYPALMNAINEAMEG
jgi:hypothetical protein